MYLGMYAFYKQTFNFNVNNCYFIFISSYLNKLKAKLFVHTSFQSYKNERFLWFLLFFLFLTNYLFNFNCTFYLWNLVHAFKWPVTELCSKKTNNKNITTPLLQD